MFSRDRVIADKVSCNKRSLVEFYNVLLRYCNIFRYLLHLQLIVSVAENSSKIKVQTTSERELFVPRFIEKDTH